MNKTNNIFEGALRISPFVGLAVMALPLYLYPMATIDPLDASPFYTSPDFMKVYLPYAVIFGLSSIGIFLKKKLAIGVLLVSFLVSHVHFATHFANQIVFKPLFVVGFIFIPAVIFLLAAFSLFVKQ